MKTRIFALGLAVLLVFTMLAGCSGGGSALGVREFWLRVVTP